MLKLQTPMFNFHVSRDTCIGHHMTVCAQNHASSQTCRYIPCISMGYMDCISVVRSATLQSEEYRRGGEECGVGR